MHHKPSIYQQDIFDFVKYGYGNGVINAKAGSGKSTTAVQALDFIKPEKKVLFLAFNNSIVEDLQLKIKRNNTDVKTLHSLGYSILNYNYRELNLTVDEYKYKKILNFKLQESDDLVLLKQKEIKKYKTNILKLIDLGRFYLVKNESELENVALKHNVILIKNEVDVSLEIIREAKTLFKETKTIDFGDMLYLPNVLPVRTLKYDFIFVDEAQDLSQAQMQLFLKCFKQGGRFICIGDEKQCINAFVGSDIESFTNLKKLPNVTELPLSICYRCPSSILDLAKKFVPDIEPRENAPVGSIKYNATIDDIGGDDMVICRNTLPLVKLYIMLLNKGIKAYVKGKDVGDKLINLVENNENEELNLNLDNEGVFSELYSELLSYIEQTKRLLDIQETDVYETQEFNNLLDSIECLEMLSQDIQTKQQLLDKLNLIFKDNENNGVCLSTIHKAKGLESDNVFILNKNLLPSRYVKQDWELEQEKNLEYVALTRSKKTLGFIYSKEFNSISENKNIEEKILDLKYKINNL